MSTFHRRNGRVKYVPPKRLLEGLRPAVAIPAVLFAAAVMVAVLFALAKAPKEQKWVNLQPQDDWKPAYSDNGEPLAADPHFLFERPLERALTPTATRLTASAPPSETPAAGRVVIDDGERIVVEHTVDTGAARSFVRSEWSGYDRDHTGVGLNVQRGDLVAEGAALTPKLADTPLKTADYPAPVIRESAPEQALRFAP
jgi:hypothetical protein